MTATATADRRPIDGSTLAKRGAAALVISLVGNLLLLQVVLAGDLVEPFDPLAVSDVAVATALGVIGATVVYGILTRLSDAPDRTFAIVTAIVLALSFLPDVALLESEPAATVPAVVVLMVMYVVVATSCVAVLTDRVSPL